MVCAMAVCFQQCLQVQLLLFGLPIPRGCKWLPPPYRDGTIHCGLRKAFQTAWDHSLLHPSCQHHTKRSVASTQKLSASHIKVSCFWTKVVTITQKGRWLLHPSCQHHAERSVASAPKLSASQKMVSGFCTKVVSIMQKDQLLLHQSCQHHAETVSCFCTKVVSITQKGLLLPHTLASFTH